MNEMKLNEMKLNINSPYIVRVYADSELFIRFARGYTGYHIQEGIRGLSQAD
jgi:hypothetical protein